MDLRSEGGLVVLRHLILECRLQLLSCVLIYAHFLHATVWSPADDPVVHIEGALYRARTSLPWY